MLIKNRVKIVSTVLTTILMTGILSGSLTFINLGLHSFYIGKWLITWMIAFIIVCPLNFSIPRSVERLVTIFFNQ